MAEESQHERTPAGSDDCAFLRPIVFLEPDRVVQPPSWLEHIPFAFWIMDVLRPRVFVELGTHSGNSYGAFAQAIQHLGLNAAGFSIDTWVGDSQAGLYDESVFVDWKAYHDRRYSAFSALIRSTFDDAAAHFADGSIDLLHLDGCHTADAVSHDFETWHPRMSSRGVMLLHDINVRERDFGAWKLWDRLRQSYPSFGFLHGHGLGVLGVGTELPPEISWLFDASPSDPRLLAVRQLFARAGATILNRFSADDSLRKMSAEARQQAATDRENLVRELTAETANRDEIIADLNARLSTAVNQATVERERSGMELDAARRAAEAEKEVIADLKARLSTAVNQTTVERERSGMELDAARRAAEAEKTALFNLIVGHRAAQRRQEVVNQLADDSMTAVRGEMDALRTRSRFLGEELASVQAPQSSRLGRLWQTIRSLGIAPVQLIGHARRLSTAFRLVTRPQALSDAHVIMNSGIFDAAHYCRLYPLESLNGLSPLAHFVLTGGAEGRTPHPLFDASWYLTKHPDVARSGANPLVHYLQTIHQQSFDPHPLFSVEHYRSQYAQSESVRSEPLHHYLTHGASTSHSPHSLFDPEYYIAMYGHVVAGADPLMHFIEVGGAAGFNPHPLFDVAFYCSQNPVQLTQNPLVHYLQRGCAQRLRPHPLFDPAYYLSSHHDVEASGMEPLTHFVLFGGLEGRRPIAQFDSAWYLSTYSDVRAGRVNPLIHFVRYGWREHRNPSPHFDTIGYLIRNPDVAATRTNPLAHYVQFGRAEGRSAEPQEAGPGAS